MLTKDNIRVFLADDHQIFIEGVKSVLNEKQGIECNIVGEANNGRDVIRKLRKAKADVLLLDVNLPDIDGLEILKKIRKYDNELKIIMLTMYDESKIVRSAFKAGVDGYILKKNGVKELYKAIEEVLLGNTFFGQDVLLNDEGKRKKTPAQTNTSYSDKFVKKYRLTKRELEVLKLVAQALNKKQIAQELYISEQTVMVHKKNIMRKLGVTSIAGLIKLVYDKNIV